MPWLHSVSVCDDKNPAVPSPSSLRVQVRPQPETVIVKGSGVGDELGRLVGFADDGQGAIVPDGILMVADPHVRAASSLPARS